MIVLELFSWWYGAGWRGLTHRVMARVDHVLELFSVSILLRTLFSPFRQISAGQVQGPMNVQMRAFFERLFSRFFGAFLRSSLVVMGFISAVVAGLLGLLQLLLWPIVPLLPVAGLVATVTRWGL